MVRVRRQCQVCERHYCVTKSDLLVPHSYTRPAQKSAQCPGVGHVDSTKGTDALVHYKHNLIAMLNGAKRDLLPYTRKTITHFQTRTVQPVKDAEGFAIYVQWRKVETEVVVTDWSPGVSDPTLYAKHLRMEHYAAVSRVAEIQAELSRVEKRIVPPSP